MDEERTDPSLSGDTPPPPPPPPPSSDVSPAGGPSPSPAPPAPHAPPPVAFRSLPLSKPPTPPPQARSTPPRGGTSPEPPPAADGTLPPSAVPRPGAAPKPNRVGGGGCGGRSRGGGGGGVFRRGGGPPLPPAPSPAAPLLPRPNDFRRSGARPAEAGGGASSASGSGVVVAAAGHPVTSRDSSEELGDSEDDWKLETEVTESANNTDISCESESVTKELNLEGPSKPATVKAANTEETQDSKGAAAAAAPVAPAPPPCPSSDDEPKGSGPVPVDSLTDSRSYSFSASASDAGIIFGGDAPSEGASLPSLGVSDLGPTPGPGGGAAAPSPARSHSHLAGSSKKASMPSLAVMEELDSSGEFSGPRRVLIGGGSRARRRPPGRLLSAALRSAPPVAAAAAASDPAGTDRGAPGAAGDDDGGGGDDRSLFDNLDRAWAAAASSRGRPAAEAERMCLAAFALAFDGAGAYPYPAPPGPENDGGGASSARPPPVPLAAAKLLWRSACPPAAASRRAMRSVVDALTSEMGFLMWEDVGGVPCLRLSHVTYGRYGMFVLRRDLGERFADAARECHREFAGALEGALNGDGGGGGRGGGDDYPVRLYAAASLPAHLLRSGDTERAAALLRDPAFAARRMDLLGHARPPPTPPRGDVGRAAGGGEGPNALQATTFHVVDLEKTATALLAAGAPSGGEEEVETERKVLDMYGAWKEECLLVPRRAADADSPTAEGGEPRSSSPRARPRRRGKASSTKSAERVHKSGKTKKTGDRPASAADGAVPDALPTESSEADSDAVSRGAGAWGRRPEPSPPEEAPEELQNAAHDAAATAGPPRRGGAAGRRSRRSARAAGSAARAGGPDPGTIISFTHDGDGADAPWDAYGLKSPSLVTSSLSSSDGSLLAGGCHRPNGAPPRSWRGRPRRRMCQGSGAGSPADGGDDEEAAGMTLLDVLGIRISDLRAEAAAGRALHLLAESLGRVLDSGGGAVPGKGAGGCYPFPRLRIRLLVSSMGLYARAAASASYLLSDDLDSVGEGDLAELRALGLLGGGGGDTAPAPGERLRWLRSDQAAAGALTERLRVLSAEGWYHLGLCLAELGDGDYGESAVAVVAAAEELKQLDMLDRTGFLGGRGYGDGGRDDGLSIVTEGDEAGAVTAVQERSVGCYRFGLHLLSPYSASKSSIPGTPGAASEASSAVSLSFDPALSGNFSDLIKSHAEGLRASLLHSLGVHHYERVGDLNAASSNLTEAMKVRRRLLQRLQDDEGGAADDGTVGSATSKMSYFLGTQRRRGSNGSISTAGSLPGSVRAQRSVGAADDTTQASAANSRSVGDLSKCGGRSPTDPPDPLMPSPPPRSVRIRSLESALSSTLECLALTLHSLGNPGASQGLFQEALILRALHGGKDCLDVASLQYNIGVVLDDLGQYEVALAKYGESLGARWRHLERLLSSGMGMPGDASLLAELEGSVILTLKCMGNVYRILNDPDGSVECYLNVVDLLKGRFAREGNDFDANYLGFGNLVRGTKGRVMGVGCGKRRSIPLPMLVLEEVRRGPAPGAGKGSAEELRAKLTKVLSDAVDDAHTSDVSVGSDGDSESESLLKEMAAMFSTVIGLIETKRQGQDNSPFGSGGSGQGYSSSGGYSSLGYSPGGSGGEGYGSSSSFRGSVPAGRGLGMGSAGASWWTSLTSYVAKNEEARSDDAILLKASYHLGKIYMHFGDYVSAITYLEEALRTLWTHRAGSEAASSSDYSSDDSDGSGYRYNQYGSWKGGRGALPKRSAGSRSGRRRGGNIRRPERADKALGEKEGGRPLVEEGVLYHAMAVSHAALGEHERAVRCYVTSLRYYRNRAGLGSWSVAGALYDCGLSYWSLGEHGTAGEFWSDCLKIALDNVKGGGSSVPSQEGGGSDGQICLPVCTIDTVSGGLIPNDVRVADTLYNLVAAKCALGEYDDPSTLKCLQDAVTIYKHQKNVSTGPAETEMQLEVAHCYFYLGLVYFKIANDMPKDSRLLSSAPLNENSQSEEQPCCNGQARREAEQPMTLKSGLQLALAYLEDALNIYESRLPEHNQTAVQAVVRASVRSGEDPTKLWITRHPMQAHIAYLSGLVHDGLGDIGKAMKDFTCALRLSHLLFGQDNVYSASLLHDMGMLFCRIDRRGTALKCLDDSLAMRKVVMGVDHPITADTLYSLGTLHAGFGQYNDCISAYSGCLQIRNKLEGSDAGVAKLLVNMGIVHARHGLYHKALESLESALKVRHDRVKYMETALKVKRCTNGSVGNRPKGRGDGSSGCDNVDNDAVAREADKTRRELHQEERELAIVFHNLGNVYLKRGEMERAIQNYECALKIRRRHCGCQQGGFAEIALSSSSNGEVQCGEEELEGMADTLHSMGCAYEATKRFNLALGCYNEALVIKRSLAVTDAALTVSPSTDSSDSRAIVPVSHENMSPPRFDESTFTLSYANTLIRIGSVHAKLANYDISLSHYESALRVQRRRLGRDHIAVARTLSDMGRILRRRGAATAAGLSAEGNLATSEAIAMKCYNEALRISKLRFGPYHVTVAGVMVEMGGIYDGRGDYDRAIGCYRHSLRVYGRRYAQNLFRQILGNSDNLFVGMDGFGHEAGDAAMGSDTSKPHTAAREQYMKVSEALQKSVRQSYGSRLGGSLILGVLDAESCSSVDNCWMSLEMLLFRLMELVGIYLVAPMREKVHTSIDGAIRRIDAVGQHAIVTAHDAIAHQFLYLIHE